MKKTDFSKIFKFSVIIVLIAAMALCIISCGGNNTSDTEAGTNAPSQSTGFAESPASSESEAKYTLTVTVIDDKGESKDFEIKTNADNLGDALLEAKLVEGEEGEFGLYIKSVNGLRADYDLDGAYWSLSKGGEMLMTGASDTPIADGDKFELTYTKG